MKPGWWRYVLAHGFVLSMSVGALATAIWIGAWLWPLASYLTDLSFVGWFALAILLSLLLGWVLGAFALWPIIGSITGNLNGAPFHRGDLVRILRGPYRDRMAEVYKLWPERRQVRVRLDAQHEQDVTDVFGYHEVCRAQRKITLK